MKSESHALQILFFSVVVEDEEAEKNQKVTVYVEEEQDEEQSGPIITEIETESIKESSDAVAAVKTS